MKIKANRAVLQAAIDMAKGVASPSVSPIMNNVLFESADDGSIKVTASDGDITLVQHVQCTVEQPGGTTIPARFLGSAVSVIGSQDVCIDAPEQDQCSYAHISGCGVDYKVSVMPASEFPRQSRDDNKTSFFVRQEDLKNILRKTVYAVSTDSTRGVFLGVCLRLRGNELHAIATDGRRLSRAVTTVTDQGAGEMHDGDAIIKPAHLKTVMRMLGDGGVVISFGESSVSFCATSWEVKTKVMAGVFPDVDGLLQGSSEVEFSVGRREFAESLRQIMVSLDDLKPIAVVTVSSNEVVVKTQSGASDASSAFPVKYDGPTFRFAFDPRLALDVLTNADEDEVSIFGTNGNPKIIFRDGASFDGLVMQMNVL